MNTISFARTQDFAPRWNDAPAPPPTDAPAPPTDTPPTPDPQPPADEPTDSFAFRLARGTATTVAGFGGALAGAPVGAVRAAFGKSFVLGETAHRLVRGGACLAGLAAGVAMGAALGPLGIVGGLIAGPIVGAAAGSALVGAVEGLGAALMGAAKGAVAGAKRFGNVAGKAVDALAGKDDAPPAQPAAPAPQPPEQAPAA
ncbi:MAG: hypothetical protein FJX76_21895 [Armatimonadetes bacterium]|nr:hypothetical protein [Armatimonadota bacterium]